MTFNQFSTKISQELKRPQQKFIHQMIYGILAGNKLHLSEMPRSLKEDYAVIVIDNSDIAKPASRKMKALSEIRDGSTGEITQGCLTRQNHH